MIFENLLQLRIKWNPSSFKQQEECPICLVEYKKGDMVTPLPCDVRHYFHTHCIEDWFHTEQSCPLCKVAVTAQEIERVAYDYT